MVFALQLIDAYLVGAPADLAEELKGLQEAEKAARDQGWLYLAAILDAWKLVHADALAVVYVRNAR